MRTRRSQGLTLIEVMIAAFVLAIIVVAIYALIFRSSRAYADGSKMATLYENGRRALDEMANELRLADSTNTIVTSNYVHPTDGATNASAIIDAKLFTGFQTPNDPTTDQVFNSVLSFNLELSPVDANNNGSTADDWRLRRKRVDTDPITAVATTTSVVLCDYVKPGSLNIVKTNANLAITLTLHVRDDKNKIQERTVTTSVTLRNKPATP